MRVSLEVSFSFKSDIDGGSVLVELAEGADVMTALRALARLYPPVASRIFAPEGGVRPYINVLKRACPTNQFAHLVPDEYSIFI